MNRISATLSLLLTVGCGHGLEPGVFLETDRSTYDFPADGRLEIGLKLTNNTDSLLEYGLCTARLEKRLGSTWLPAVGQGSGV